MPVPSYGALPLAKFFLFVRALQLISFIAIVGITANFVSEIVSTGGTVAKEIVGTLTVVRYFPSLSSILLYSKLQQLTHRHLPADLDSNALHPHHDPLLLRPGQPRPPGHVLPRLPLATSLHHRVRHPRQAHLLPQLLPDRLDLLRRRRRLRLCLHREHRRKHGQGW